MLIDVQAGQWLKLILSGLIFIGPGVGILSFLKINTKFRISLLYIFAFVLSVAFWSIFLAYLRFFKINVLYPWFVYLISISGWMIGVIREKQNQKIELVGPDIWEVFLVLALISSLFINIFALRHMVVGLGSDSNHHTLITQLIIWNKGLPNNYSPAYPEIITFNYHFGFHTLAAILSLLSGWEPRLIVLVLAPILISLSGLAAAYFSWRVFQSEAAMSFVGIIPSLIAVFPTAMLEWGRYPQTLGLILLSVFIAEYLTAHNNDVSKWKIFLISILASGLSLTHYRVTIMGIVAVMIWEIFNFWRIKHNFQSLRARLLFIGLISFLVVFFVWPWFLQVYLNQFVGYPAQYSVPAESFFSISRLGTTALEYPTNGILIGAFALFGAWTILKRDRVGLWIFFWLILLLVSSWITRGLKYTIIDPVTVISSSYTPIAIMIGWGINNLEKIKYSITKKILFPSIFLLACLWGAFHMNGLLNVPAAAYVKPEDIEAAKWIKQNTPEDACFMISTYRFEFSTNFIIGSDAGGWLPVLAQRCVVTYPMTSNIERFDHPNTLEKVVKIHKLNGDLTSEEALQLLSSARIEYIYDGGGGEIKVDSKDLNLEYELEVLYEKDPIRVYRINFGKLVR